MIEPEDKQELREAWDAFRRASVTGKLKATGGAILLLPVLAVLFLLGFFAFGGWSIFDEHLPGWLERLFTFLIVVLVAWAALKPVFDRWEKEAGRKRT